MPEPRTVELYFGETVTPFTILSRFQMTDSSVNFGFDTWATADGFANYEEPLSRLAVSFSPDADWRTQNAMALASIRDAVLDILGVLGRGWTLLNFYINTKDKVLEATARSPEGEETKSDSVSGATYDALIAGHLDLVGTAVTLAWTYGKTNDAFLAAMTAS